MNNVVAEIDRILDRHDEQTRCVPGFQTCDSCGADVEHQPPPARQVHQCGVDPGLQDQADGLDPA